MFSEKKFLSFSLKMQHKKAAELLRYLYESRSPLADYRMLEAWLKLPKVELSDEALANRFHYHLKYASVSLKEHNLLPNLKRFDKLTQASFGSVAIYLDQLRSGHNVGSILRTIEAFRLGTVYFSPNMPEPSNKKIQDTSMGTAPLVPRAELPLKRLPKPLVALETVEGASSLFDFHFPETFSLLIGNEEYGLSKESLEASDHIVEIPLVGSKNSLNVACAFAIAAAEICRQRINSQE